MFGKKRHSFNLLFVLLLLGVFAMSAIFVAVMGTKIYANSADKLHSNFETRTGIVYLSEKIRAASSSGSVDVRTSGGIEAIVLSENVGGTVYESWIYVTDGMLREATVMQGSTFNAVSGQAIMAMRSLSAEKENGGITIGVETEDGQTLSTFISERTDG